MSIKYVEEKASLVSKLWHFIENGEHSFNGGLIELEEEVISTGKIYAAAHLSLDVVRTFGAFLNANPEITENFPQWKRDVNIALRTAGEKPIVN